MRRALLLLVLASAACAKQPAPTLAERGAALYRPKGCQSCHSIDGSAKTGPTWKGLYGSTVPLADGSTAVADEAYLRRSITDPDAQTVRGFPPAVMATVIRPGSLTDAQVAALVAYIKTLR